MVSLRGGDGGQPESPDVAGVPDQRRGAGNVGDHVAVEICVWTGTVPVRGISLGSRAERGWAVSIRVSVTRIRVAAVPAAAVPDGRRRGDELDGRGATLRPAAYRRPSGQRGQSPHADADRHGIDE